MYIGIDGGGTKTKGVLCNDNLNIIASVIYPSSNYISVGMEKTIIILKELITELLLKSDNKNINIALGLAGVSNKEKANTITKKLKVYFPKNNIFVCGDDIITIYSSGIENNIASLVAGTGSVCIYMNNDSNKNPKFKKIGALGHILGDEGSGYYIVKQAIKLSLEYEQETNNKTSIIMKQLIDFFKVKNNREVLLKIYNAPKSEIASASKVVMDNYNSSRISQIVINDSVNQLVTIVKKATNNKPCNILFSGGIIANKTIVQKKLIKKLAKYNVIKAKYQPAIGAIIAQNIGAVIYE